MGKAKKVNQQKPAVGTAKAIKEGSVHKNKVEKFKKTPTGKVALVQGNGKANGAPKNQKNNKQPAKKQTPSPPKNQKKNQQKTPPKGGSPKKPVQKKNKQVKKSEEEEESDDDINEGISINEDVSLNEEEEDDSSEEEEVAAAQNLGASLANDSDEDDEDFEGEEDDDDEEDDDISEEEEEDSQEEKNQSNDSGRFNSSSDSSDKSPKKKAPELTPEEKAERDARTIFIGNVPLSLEEKALREAFKKYGAIDTVRIRGIVPESPKVSKKVAAIKKKIHPACKAVCVYIVFKNADSVGKALEMNGKKLGGNWLRVDKIGVVRDPHPEKSIFIGNVPYDVEDNDLWTLFSDCGKIDYVRTVRDRFTGLCRGMAYVNFISADSAILAKDLDGTLLKKRKLRVVPYDPKRRAAAKENGSGQKRPHSGKDETKSAKKQKTNEVEKATKNSQNAEKRIAKKDKKAGGFQGQKADDKKKAKKETKFDKKKKNVAAKLLSKPKKPKAQ
uniref:RRM domain-containing protein n=1 Tax=Bracon brevicornis TaxID=1563983 RepID=A0A6V7MBB1_9HYME